MRDEIKEKIVKSISEMVTVQSLQEFGDGKSLSEQLAEQFSTIIPFDENSLKQIAVQLEQTHSVEDKISFLTTVANDIYSAREKQMGEELMKQVERYVELSIIDSLWMDHLDAIENLRQGIGLRGYGQKDPLVEYKNEGFTMFEKLINGIDDEIVHRIYRIQVEQPPIIAPQHQHIVAQPAGSDKPQTASSSSGNINITKSSSASTGGNKKLGRNDPCWCGSGKKYKKCHYPN
ncbi:MAG: SEC-C metal-binding domain-containing protein [Patescibacteria group bacterium]|nr:SEC-C metal-binding domain-containing protein [Patescibacteria group bacterium]